MQPTYCNIMYQVVWYVCVFLYLQRLRDSGVSEEMKVLYMPCMLYVIVTREREIEERAKDVVMFMSIFITESAPVRSILLSAKISLCLCIFSWNEKKDSGNSLLEINMFTPETQKDIEKCLYQCCLPKLFLYACFTRDGKKMCEFPRVMMIII